MKADILCETAGCPKEHDIINTVTFPMEEEDTFYEAFGHGGEEEADFCPECKQLGVLQDPDLDDEVKEFIKQARELYADKSDDNIEIDDDAKTSMATDPNDRDGVWVQAWVWVPIDKKE